MKNVVNGSIVSGGVISVKIDEYISKNGCNPNYIIMSGSTASMMEAVSGSVSSRSIEKYSEFCGVPVAICNRLRTGEFEIV